MIEPKQVEIDGRQFILHKLDYWSGREIITQYPLSGMPKLGDYHRNEELAFKLLSHVSIPMDSGLPLKLSTKELIANHVGGWETGMKLEWAMIQYNTSFFQNGSLSTLLDEWATMLPVYLSKILTAWQESSSQKEKPPLTS